MPPDEPRQGERASPSDATELKFIFAGPHHQDAYIEAALLLEKAHKDANKELSRNTYELIVLLRGTELSPLKTALATLDEIMRADKIASELKLGTSVFHIFQTEAYGNAIVTTLEALLSIVSTLQKTTSALTADSALSPA